MGQTATKTEIMEFIDKVKAKAVKAVMDKYNAVIAEEIKNYMLQPENETLRGLFTQQRELFAALTAVEDKLAEAFKAEYGDSDYFNRATRYTFPSFSAERQWFEGKGTPKNAIKVKAAKADMDRAVATVTQEYGKIKGRLEQKQTNLQQNQSNVARIAYLESLGFDCSALKARKEQPAPEINIAALFPCGDNK